MKIKLLWPAKTGKRNNNDKDRWFSQLPDPRIRGVTSRAVPSDSVFYQNHIIPLWSPLRLEVCHRCDCTLPTGVSDAIADNHCLWSRRITTNHIFLCHSGLKFCHKWFPWAFLSAGNHQSPSLGQWSLQTLLNDDMWTCPCCLFFVQFNLSESFKHFPI